MTAWDCETCPFRLERERLPEIAWRAMELYRWVASAVVVDLHLTPLVFEWVALSLTRREVGQLLGCLEAVHRHRRDQVQQGDE